MQKFLYSSSLLVVTALFFMACNEGEKATPAATATAHSDTPEFFLLRPELEKAYGYSHAVKIGSKITISGAVSMDSAGTLLAPGNIEQQMKNCYADLKKILDHYGCSYDEVVVENILTTDMQGFIKVAGFRNSIYTKHFPAGSWLGVRELALPGQLIEIEWEVHKANVK